MKNKPVEDRVLTLNFNDKLKLKNPEDFDLTLEQVKFLEIQLALLIEETKAGTNLFVVRDI